MGEMNWESVTGFTQLTDQNVKPKKLCICGQQRNYYKISKKYFY